MSKTAGFSQTTTRPFPPTSLNPAQRITDHLRFAQKSFMTLE
jgi:hypothetical protein